MSRFPHRRRVCYPYPTLPSHLPPQPPSSSSPRQMLDNFNSVPSGAVFAATVGAAFVGGLAAGRYLFPSPSKRAETESDDEDDDSDDSATDTDSEIEVSTDPSKWGITSAPYKLCLCINKELKMGPGKVAAQCSHAAVGCYKRGLKQYPSAVKAWEWTGCAKIACKLQGSSPDNGTAHDEMAALRSSLSVRRGESHTTC
jgi:hypothetical protein